ncbi:MAG TPA: hypothetical protein VFE24_02925 [Pirellulales bacterium]|jgi:hypothetical protein|nr:hypothetical protein [Pirellulales bacterium]
MTEPTTLRKSKYRTVLNVCSFIWYGACAILFVAAVALAGVSIYCLIAHPVGADGKELDPRTLQKGIYLAIACGLVDVAIVIFGRRYFRRAFARMDEIDKLERRGPRRG